MTFPLRLVLLTLVIVAGSLPARAQDDDPLAQYIVNRIYSFPELTRMVSIHLPRMVAEDKPDSARFLVEAWTDGFPASPIHWRTLILMDIWQDRFRERDYEELISNLVISFDQEKHDEEAKLWAVGTFLSGKERDELARGIAIIDDFLKDFAGSLAAEANPGTMESLLTRYFGLEVDNFFEELAKPAYKDSRIRRAIYREIDSLIRPRYLFAGFQAGVYAPTESLARVESRPFMGFLGGYRWDKWQLRLTSYYAASFLDEEVLVNHEGQLRQAGTFGPISGGLDLVRTLVDHRRFRLDLLGGANYTSVRWNFDQRSHEEIQTLDSADLGLGVGIHLPFGHTDSATLGLEIWHRWVDYDTGFGGTDLDGNVWMVSLGYYFSSRFDARAYRLKKMRINRWDWDGD